MKLRDMIPGKGDAERGIQKSRDPFDSFLRDFQQLTDTFWNTDLTDFFHDHALADPKVDITSDKENVYITAEIPGVEEKDIDLTLEKGHLILSGEKKQESEEKAKGYHRIERSYGSFRRVIPLGHDVNEEQAKASYKNGVLRVVIPRTPEDKKTSRRIPVSTEE